MSLNTRKRRFGEYEDDFLLTINKIFSIARFMGVTTYGYKVAFAWSLSVGFVLLTILVASIVKLVRLVAGIARNHNAGRGFIGRLSGSIFYGNAFVSLLLTVRFLSSWTDLSITWMRANTASGLDLPQDSNIRKRVIFVTSFVMTCAFDEYSIWVAIPIFIISKVATFLWNFQDLLIILISMGLASRYHRLNLYVKCMIKFERKYKDVQMLGADLSIQMLVWRRLREAYVFQSALVHQVNTKLGALILLSNINNLYFICLQLFFGIGQEKGSVINRAYYLFSLGWLLFRACSVVIAASDVYVHSKQALSSLYACPGTVFNIEIKRLINQLANENVSLSGLGLFRLNRNLLLQVAAAILKYELVLIQYDYN